MFFHLKTQHVATCCERLHTSANIAQKETTLLGTTMLRVVARVCTGLNYAFHAPLAQSACFIEFELRIHNVHKRKREHKQSMLSIKDEQSIVLWLEIGTTLSTDLAVTKQQDKILKL